jgi:hypothetical protein
VRHPLPVLVWLVAVAAGSCAAAAAPPNVAVTKGAADLEGAALAIDPTDPSRLAVAYSTGRSGATGSCLVSRSNDAGRTWESETVVGDAARPLPTGATHCADPALAFGSEGTLYVAYDVSQLGGPGRVYLTSSTDHGATFRRANVLDPNPPGGGDFEPAVAAGPSHGTVSVAFQRYGSSFDEAAVLAGSSDDAGLTVSAPVRVSPPAQDSVNARVAAGIDRGGNLYVAWVDAGDVDFDGSGTARLEVATSPDGGRTFTPPATVAAIPSGCGPNDDCGNRYPAVTLAAGAEGVVDLAWSAGAYPDAARVFVARSRDTGRSWTAPKKIRLPAGAADHDEFGPSIVVAPDGRVDLGWADQARDRDSGLLDVYLSYSLDGARTFSAPLRLDSSSTTVQQASFAPAVDVAASNGAAHAAWQGSEILFARIRDASAPQRPTVDGPRRAGSVRPSFRLRSSDDFTPSAALRFRCSFDGAPFHACGARYAQLLRRGRHVFRVRALDRAGKLSAVRTLVVRVS